MLFCSLLHATIFIIGYRRITAEVDERHIIARKLLQSCGFQLEVVLRKHKIVCNRNRNTALYVLLNSDLVDIETILKRTFGVTTKQKTQ